MKARKAKGVLFAPEWRSAYYWPLITDNGKYFATSIQEFRKLAQ